MKESFWGIMIFMFGVLSILIVYFFQSMTNTDEHNYTLLKEATEGAMIDAIDLAYYRKEGVVRIDQEKFVENFIRRFAQSAQLSRTYTIRIHDVSELPPKVSLSVTTNEDTNLTGDLLEFTISNRLDAILETPRNCKINTIVKPDEGPEIIMPDTCKKWVYNNDRVFSSYDQSGVISSNLKLVCQLNPNQTSETNKYMCDAYVCEY